MIETCISEGRWLRNDFVMFVAIFMKFSIRGNGMIKNNQDIS